MSECICKICSCLYKMYKYNVHVYMTVHYVAICLHINYGLVHTHTHTHTTDNRSTVLNEVDFIVCIGGDGTILYTASLFKVCC